MRRLLAAAVLSVLALPPTAQAKFSIRMNVAPTAPHAGERTELSLHAYWEPGEGMTDAYPFRVVAVAPGVSTFAALRSIHDPHTTLRRSDRFPIPLRQRRWDLWGISIRTNLWTGTFRLPRRGRWQLIDINFVDAGRRIAPFARIDVTVAPAGR